MPDPLYSNRYTQAFPIVPSDSTPIQGPIQSGGKPTPYCSGIHVLVAGDVTAIFKDDRGDGSIVTFSVQEGHYPYGLSFVFTTSTATLLGLL